MAAKRLHGAKERKEQTREDCRPRHDIVGRQAARSGVRCNEHSRKNKGKKKRVRAREGSCSAPATANRTLGQKTACILHGRVGLHSFNQPVLPRFDPMLEYKLPPQPNSNAPPESGFLAPLLSRVRSPRTPLVYVLSAHSFGCQHAAARAPWCTPIAASTGAQRPWCSLRHGAERKHRLRGPPGKRRGRKGKGFVSGRDERDGGVGGARAGESRSKEGVRERSRARIYARARACGRARFRTIMAMDG